MLSNSLLHAVTMIAGIAWLSSAHAGESRIDLDEFAVSWQGDGQLRVCKDERGRTTIHCQCRGDVRVTNEQFEAQAKQLTYDSANQVLLLEGGVKLKVHDIAGQPTVGELFAQRVTLKMADDQVVVEMIGAKLNGTVRLRAKVE